MENITLLRTLRKAIYNRPLEQDEQYILEQWQGEAGAGKIFESDSDRAADKALILKNVQAVRNVKELQELFSKLFSVGKYPVSKLGERIQYPILPFEEEYDPASLETSAGKIAAHYEIRELDDLIPSHDPLRQFAKREDYPEGVQERPYHSDEGEKDKVRRNAANLNPRYLLNTNPDAMTGPPVITSGGIVLGGNSRTMSMQLAYESFPKKAQEYRDFLIKLAPVFGFTAAQVESMEKPALVRVTNQEMDAQEMAQASRRFNETTTQALQLDAEGVSKSKLVTKKTLSILRTDMQEFDSLREYLGDKKSLPLIDSLLTDGVIEQAQLSRITNNDDGLLNSEGKALIEATLRGLIVQDYDILRKAPASVVAKIDRAIPALAQLKGRGGDWDISDLVARALVQIRKALDANFSLKEVGAHFRQEAIVPDPDRNHKGIELLALTLAYATPKEVTARLNAFAFDSAKTTEGVSTLAPNMAPGAEKAFVKAFLRTVVSVGNTVIGDFSPEESDRHAAIQWAAQSAKEGERKTVERAKDKLAKEITSFFATPEAKEEAKKKMRLLSSLSGEISIYEPNLGKFFTYSSANGDTLLK